MSKKSIYILKKELKLLELTEPGSFKTFKKKLDIDLKAPTKQKAFVALQKSLGFNGRKRAFESFLFDYKQKYPASNVRFFKKYESRYKAQLNKHLQNTYIYDDNLAESVLRVIDSQKNQFKNTYDMGFFRENIDKIVKGMKENRVSYFEIYNLTQSRFLAYVKVNYTPEKKQITLDSLTKNPIDKLKVNIYLEQKNKTFNQLTKEEKEELQYLLKLKSSFILK